MCHSVQRKRGRDSRRQPKTRLNNTNLIGACYNAPTFSNQTSQHQNTKGQENIHNTHTGLVAATCWTLPAPILFLQAQASGGNTNRSLWELALVCRIINNKTPLHDTAQAKTYAEQPTPPRPREGVSAQATTRQAKHNNK